ncbi:Uncharacterized membrane protein YccC [Lentibacillus persicus]|uniref:Uncharacterized membrane protein YccC n=1 Tax=Lentibacillus persicus TaxID=640948 RepID=A0A1I1ZZW9_9BACI|nr:FUSC family protein [Lentibacillus persicus]SFE37384.1 Uncharacterized membrane protein YccC [Lentibacillus persicus]
MTTHNSSKSPSLIRQALKVNRNPFPWLKAFRAGLAAGLPVFIGLLFGNLQYGLTAALGGFTYLYVFNVPYAQRAKKIFFVVLAMTLIAAIGTLAAPYPLMVAVLMGIIGGTAVFIFGALKISGPNAIFFVLVFAMITGMPVDQDAFLIRAGLVFSGGALSWIIAMIDWFVNPHGPETGVVKRVYLGLASLLDAVGTAHFNEEKHRVMSVLKEAEDTLAAGYIPWRTTDLFNRLYILTDHANVIFTYIVNHFANRETALPGELAESLRILAESIETKPKHGRAAPKVNRQDSDDEAVATLYSKIFDADAIFNEPSSKINQVIRISKSSLRTIFFGAFDKNSIVFLSSVRFAALTIVAAIIAFELDLARSYWVPLSCVAVMSGSTILATYHRAIQRSIGTIVGILIASVILAAQPSGFMIALFIFLLTGITELFIVKNYGLAALFFTPNALLMAESTTQQAFSFSYFASARLIDILIGSAIGLIGVWMVGRKSASSRLPHLIAKTIRSQSQFLMVLFSDQGEGFDATKSREKLKMRTNMVNLKTVYNTASGEVPVDQRALDYYWPIVFTVEQLGYLLESCSKDYGSPNLSDDKLSQLLFAFEKMANAINRKRASEPQELPEIEGHPGIHNEIKSLQKQLSR